MQLSSPWVWTSDQRAIRSVSRRPCCASFPSAASLFLSPPLFPDTRIHLEDIPTSRMSNENMQDGDGALNLHLPGLGLVDVEWVKLIKGIGDLDLLDSREMRLTYRGPT
ncbi:hypothetical protein PAXRUDRAFT_835775 [Paxillus rubicundulus Ve08.2h10]|uniref:Uncharacterized protein n=1 Tax=Paxillus rubicundulus Ve08.2h10 TaxID=930991 RepID=A0A0D0DCT1_9AGAM|nr:hypothetical protein PAXRUDRAFT_835775 [Paxillus rubicundulus Ve08.2h10]